MEPYKARLIEFLFSQEEVLQSGRLQLKSGRISPYFLKLDAVNDGQGLIALGEAYAEAILANVRPEDFDGIIGIPSKAHVFGPGIVAELARRGYNKKYSSYRDKPKTHGDATFTGTDIRKQRQKEYILGAQIPDGSRQLILDDVMTAGDSKRNALDMINYVAQNVTIPAIVILADRQEIDEFGRNTIQEFTREQGIPVIFTITASDIFDYLKEKIRISPSGEADFLRYFRAWGTPELRERYGLVSRPLIEGRTVIPACDIDNLERFEQLVRETADMEKIGGYKLGFELGLRYGLPRLVEIIKSANSDKVIIYDHQKGGTDIGDISMARKFARTAKDAEVDAVILFPLSGPITQTLWTGEALQAGLEVIIGGHMTHRGFAQKEGGYIRDDAPLEIYLRAANHGVVNFVVPGNDPEAVRFYREQLEAQGISPVFYAPGFVAQKGVISDTGKVAGESFHAIVGRDIINATNIRAKAEELTSQL